MSDVKYEVVEENLEAEGVKYTAYGIIIYKEKKVVRYISDVFLNKDEANELVKIINEEDLSPIHIDYIIEDVIGK